MTTPLQTFTYAELRAAGHARRRITRAVAAGELIRVRRGSYVVAGAHRDHLRAARAGGALGCTSLLASLGVFVHSTEQLHIVVPQGASRLGPRPRGVIRHWRRRAESPVVAALAQACRCQNPSMAVATLDSAWHRGLIAEEDLAHIFSLLPQRYRVLRALVDRSAESGPESLVRLMLRRLACSFRTQVAIDGVGRVDFLVDGWLIVECDSREFHGDWSVRRRDYKRDLAAARRGYTTLRINAEDILYDRDAVFHALRAVVSRSRPVHNSFSTAPGARI